MTKTKECRGLKMQNKQTTKKPFDFSSSSRIPDPFLFLENPRPLSPHGPSDFLSTCLGTDSLTLSTSAACELHENIRPERPWINVMMTK